MNTDFDREFGRLRTDDQPIPTSVRKSLDQTYEIVREKSKKRRTRSIWNQAAAATFILVLLGTLLANGQVRASITELFSFGDRGIDRAVEEGFAVSAHQSAVDQGVTITLLRNFSDANKIGMSFALDFDEPQALAHGVTDVSMDFRLKNGDGVYVDEFIPDTKPLKGDNRYNVSGVTLRNQEPDASSGRTQLDVVIESNRGTLPVLKDAVLEIESIHVFRGSDYSALSTIDGMWNINVANGDMANPVPAIEYQMASSSPDLQVDSATASPTSLNLQFSIDEVYEDETPFVFGMKLVGEDGTVYKAEGFTMDVTNNRTFISTNFPLTGYDDVPSFTFVIDGIAEVDMQKK